MGHVGAIEYRSVQRQPDAAPRPLAAPAVALVDTFPQILERLPRQPYFASMLTDRHRSLLARPYGLLGALEGGEGRQRAGVLVHGTRSNSLRSRNAYPSPAKSEGSEASPTASSSPSSVITSTGKGAMGLAPCSAKKYSISA